MEVPIVIYIICPALVLAFDDTDRKSRSLSLQITAWFLGVKSTIQRTVKTVVSRTAGCVLPSQLLATWLAYAQNHYMESVFF